MKEYLKMKDVFPVEIYTDDESGSLIVDDDGIILESFSGDKVADYTLHAINSHDELVEINKELLSVLENLLNDMRLRAKLEGDVDSDGTVILNCGNGVLFAATMAIEKAK
ncbi:MAG: hypothetical protein ACRCXB_34055 [Aeromonadaceae bacterium]